MSPENLISLAPFTGTLVLVLLGLFVIQRFVLKAHAAATGKKFRNQVIMLLLSAAGALLVVLVMPISDQKRGQILSLLGIVLSAGIALSSTTLLGNLMAGFMVRAVRAFRLGEFIEVGEHFGRVSDMGLFHVEIQTEDRDLKTLPNLLFVTNAVKRIRPSGTILSAQVSLGYDVSSSRVERLLLLAAEQVGLKEPFVRIMDVGDHAVTYKVAGLLEDVSKLLAKRSDLRGALLHVLHADGVEIVSPQFRNTRLIDAGRTFIPPTAEQETRPPSHSATEAVVFDKAEEAASLESLRQTFAELEKQKETLQKGLKEMTGTDLDRGQRELARLQQKVERLNTVIAAREDQAAEKE